MQPRFSLTSISTPADFEIFKGLLLEYAGRDLDDPGNSTIWQDIEQLPGRYTGPAGHVLLAHADNELAGCGAFAATMSRGVAEIKRVYVRAGFRRQGLARVLTQALVDQARRAGYNSVAISTWPHNLQALALYRQLGFQPVDPFKTHQHAELIFLALPLGQSSQNRISIAE